MSIYGICDNKCLKPLNNVFGNPNILVNGSFKIWQRGSDFDSTDKELYSADRWIRRNITTRVRMVANAIFISNTEENKQCGIAQPIDHIGSLLGKTVTLSVKVNKIMGAFKLCLVKSNNSANGTGDEEQSCVIASSGVHSVTFTMPREAKYMYYSVQLYSTTTSRTTYIEVEYVKLEEGSIATKNVQLPYGVELLECQRYYNKFPVIYSTRREAWVNVAGKTLVPALSFTTMRDLPTVTCKSITSVSGSTLSVDINSSRIAGNKYLTMITLTDNITEEDVLIYDLELNAEIY